MSGSPNPGILLALALAAASTITPSPLLSFLSAGVLCILWWGAFAGPLQTVMASILSVQWLQAAAKLWVANAFGVSMTVPSSTEIGASHPLEIGQSTGLATALALTGVAALSLGAHLTLPRNRLAAAEFAGFQPERLLMLYAPLLLIYTGGSSFAPSVLAQLVSALGALRFAPIILLIGTWSYYRRGGQLLLAVIALEVALGFMSYFSSWRPILLVCGITLFALSGRAWRRSLPLLAAGFAALLALSTIWTVIKPEYRQALNEGTNQQVILLTPEEQAETLARQVSSVGANDLPSGFLDMLDRASYVDYLGDVLDYVPRRVPHQGGALWWEALGQFLTPRFLFPDKPALPSDSERTMRYTGLYMASAAEGTSISIGYVGESYIDFGWPGALLIPFVLGLVYGAAVFALTRVSRTSGNAIILALTLPLIWSAQQFEMSNIKIVGALTWTFIACVLALLAWPRLIRPFVTRERRVRARLAPG